jgi:hypothetical protein
MVTDSFDDLADSRRSTESPAPGSNSRAPHARVPVGDGTPPPWYRAFFLWLYCGVKVFWLCGFATVVLILAAVAFISNDQGTDFLRILVEPLSARAGLSTRVAFFVSVVLWSLGTWYSTRLLVSRRLQGFPLPPVRTSLWRVAVPRLLGTAAPAIIGVSFLHLALSDESPLKHRLIGAATLYGALAVFLLVFYWKRRKWLPRLTGGIQVDEMLPQMPRASSQVIAISLCLSFLLLLLFVFAPVMPARFLGTPALFVLAATSMLLFAGIVLTYAPLAAGYPGLLLPVLVAAALLSQCTDNHLIRTAQPAPSGLGTDVRKLPEEHFQEWLGTVEHREKSQVSDGAQSDTSTVPAASSPYPVFIVAAAGGGIRAAYWTAAVLGAVTDQVKARPWRDHLYALSGVSGGSLGAAVHVVDLAADGGDRGYAQRARDMLGQDHLSPVIAFMLYPDLVQRFIPYPIPALDRARALEESWETSARRSLGTSAFSDSFLALWRGHPYEVPALLLNSTRVETGQRAIVSNLKLSRDFLDSVDLLSLAPTAGEPVPGALKAFESLRLSSAVHLSARFTYVSPAARAVRADGALWGRLVDGGYFENSGTATAADLIRAIHLDRNCLMTPGCAHVPFAGARRAVPVVLLIENDPHAPSICDPYYGPDKTAGGLLTEVKPPIAALLAAREARGRLSEREILQLVAGPELPSGRCDDGCVLEFTLVRPVSKGGQPKPFRSVYNDPPLGWSLSESSRTAMDERLKADDTQQSMQCITDLIEGRACITALKCKTPGEARP